MFQCPLETNSISEVFTRILASLLPQTGNSNPSTRSHLNLNKHTHSICSHTHTHTSYIPSNMFTHCHIHPHTHIYSHALTNTHLTYTLKHVHTLSHIHSHTLIFTHTHTHTYLSTSGEVPDGFRVSLAGEGKQTQFSGRWECFCSRLFLTYDLKRTAPALGTLAPLVSPNFTPWWVPKKTLPGPGKPEHLFRHLWRCWERWRARREVGNRGWDGWMASLTEVWAHFGWWWRTGKPGMLQFMGSQRIRHNLSD